MLCRLGVICIVFTASSIAAAAEIRLLDGSVVIGEILALENGEDLTVDTAHMGDVTLDWDAIVSIQGSGVLTTELFDGSRITGPVVVDENGVLVGGDEPERLRRREVFEIEEYNQTFTDGLELYTDLGMNIVRGNNTVTQLNTGAGVSYDGERFETALDGSAIVNEQLGDEDTRRSTLSASYAWKFRENWDLTGIYTFEADERQNLDGRSLFAATVGNRIVNSRRFRLKLFTGLALNSEDFDLAPASESVEGVIGSTIRWRSSNDIDVDASLTILPNLEQSGRTRAQFDGSAKVDLWGDLDFRLSAYSRYDTDPPEGNSKNDYGTTVGLRWSFD